MWRVEFRPEVEEDVASAAAWYEERQPGLGGEFVEEIIQVWRALAENPLLHCRRHPTKNIRWRYPNRFPYRVILRGSRIATQSRCGSRVACCAAREALEAETGVI